MTRVLVVGSGGREHALAWGLIRSSSVDEIFGAPGNPGVAQFGECFDVAAGVPTARYGAFDAGARDAAHVFLESLPGGYVVKTDGLAAGKGVLVTDSLADARDAVDAYLSGRAFGAAGATCVIEEAIRGP